MASEKNKCVNIVKALLKSLMQDGIDVSEAYLFGSAVTGRSNEDSDIDVALVSKDFQGVPYYDMNKISRHRRKVDLRLEIHPFSLDEVLTDPPYFFLKIKQYGIRI